MREGGTCKIVVPPNLARFERDGVPMSVEGLRPEDTVILGMSVSIVPIRFLTLGRGTSCYGRRAAAVLAGDVKNYFSGVGSMTSIYSTWKHCMEYAACRSQVKSGWGRGSPRQHKFPDHHDSIEGTGDPFSVFVGPTECAPTNRPFKFRRSTFSASAMRRSNAPHSIHAPRTAMSLSGCLGRPPVWEFQSSISRLGLVNFPPMQARVH
jgi:hypothetical protein